MYIPALRWRQGEYQALLKLNEAAKNQIVPLITIPDVEFDFEAREPKKSVHDHVHPFAERYSKKWGFRPAWVALDQEIATKRMDDGSHVLDYVFRGLRSHSATAVPALPLVADSALIAATRRVIASGGQGCGILVRLEDLMARGASQSIIKLASTLQIALNESDLILDMRAPNYQPYGAFAAALISNLPRLGNLMDYRNFILIGTAIPESLVKISIGTDEIPRHDWLFYRELLQRLPKGVRRPNYGDYTTVHPNFEAKDMRLIKPAGKIVYTTDGTWATRKGGSFRDDPDQMHTHCQEILRDPRFKFRGPNFSFGDAYISDCAAENVSSSNLTRWKQVSINHHMTAVVDDLASLPAGS